MIAETKDTPTEINAVLKAIYVVRSRKMSKSVCEVGGKSQSLNICLKDSIDYEKMLEKGSKTYSIVPMH